MKHHPLLPDSNRESLAEKISDYLKELCETIPNRHLGSPGNHAATDFFTRIVKRFGFACKGNDFNCLDWEPGPAYIEAAGDLFDALVSPYSRSCDLTAPLVEVSGFDELKRETIGKKILLIHGELAAEQLMPKNFPFYQPESHKKIIAALEKKKPAAIIAATSKNPELAGALYPFPLFEDGDFSIPSVYMTEEEGTRLLSHCGKHIALRIDSRLIHSTSRNVIASKGIASGNRLIFCAHIDSKKNTPGALDNAGGVATLLALAELLKDYSKPPIVELLAFNGEEYYSAPGQVQFLEENESRLEQISLAVNLDGAGYKKGRSCFSFYECSGALAEQTAKILSNHSGLIEGPLWYQGDHMVFTSRGIPAAAITSEEFAEIWRYIAHTENDTPDLVDPLKLAEIALALKDLILAGTT